jgi:midasin (ATPase involved in ribosome maturation)
MNPNQQSVVKKFYKVSKRVAIPVNEEEVMDKNFIPKDIPFEDNKVPLEQTGISINHSVPVLLVGETGTGKTSLVRHLASKTKNAFVRVNHNGGTTIEDIIGRYLIDDKGTRWVDGILVEAMKKGYWYLADEINAASAEINFVYHSLLDDDARVLLAEKGNEVVVPHPNFRFFAGMNPPTEYAGTKELNKALLSRFAVVKIDFPAPKVEQKILVQRTGVPEQVAENMVKFAASIRNNHAKATTRFVLSTRDLIMWGQMYNVYKKYLPAAQMSILNKVGEDDVDAITDIANLSFKALDAGDATEVQVHEPEDKKDTDEDDWLTDDDKEQMKRAASLGMNSATFTKMLKSLKKASPNAKVISGNASTNQGYTINTINPFGNNP